MSPNMVNAAMFSDTNNGIDGIESTMRRRD